MPSAADLTIKIVPGGPLVPYEQLKAQIIAAIEAGGLVVGAKLPAIRALATRLDLAANTVARAYRELEAEGYLATHGRAGTTVSPHSVSIARAAAQAATAYVAATRALGLSDPAIKAALANALAGVDPKS